jgi:hypothetical protein
MTSPNSETHTFAGTAMGQQRTVSAIDAMTDALTGESRLLDELIVILKRQRSAVGTDDLQEVDDTVFATHRVLVTLNEARRRRRSINLLMGQQEDMPIGQLEEALGQRMTDALREARDELRLTARTLSREVGINRSILRQALANGDVFARTLAGVAADPVYAQGTPAPRPSSATLLDRRI